MAVYELTVASEEQSLTLNDGYVADILFDRCYKRWYYNLYKDGVLVAAGVALNPDTAPLFGYVSDSLGLSNNIQKNVDYEPYDELWFGLLLMEITK